VTPTRDGERTARYTPAAAAAELTPRIAMSPRHVRPLVPTLLAACVALGACDAGRAPDRDRHEDEAVRAAARRAAALATDERATDDTASRERATGSRDSQARAKLRVGSGSGGSIARGGDPPLAPGDVRIVSTDGALVLALVGDTVRVRLGDSLVAQVRRDLYAEPDTGAGVGDFIARTVKGAVGGAMAEATRYAMRVPVGEVRELRYEDGQLRFGSGRKSGRKRGNETSARFARADAERFIAAVRARQRALGVAPAGS
jgi:hypothetical protein